MSMGDKMELTMFERLMLLPLFHGLNFREMSEIMSHVKLDFINYQAGDEIVYQDDTCRQMIYVINGKVGTEYRDRDSRFTYYESHDKLDIIEPYNLFGMRLKYSRTYSFITDGTTLVVDKQVFVKTLLSHNIVRSNILNLVCNKYQKTLAIATQQPDGTVLEKLVKFFMIYATEIKGEKRLKIKMNDLADVVHEPRLNVSKVLNTLDDQGLIKIQRGIIRIPELLNLKELTQKTQ